MAVWSKAYENAWTDMRMCFEEYEAARKRASSGDAGVMFDLLVGSNEPLGSAGIRQAIYLNDVPADKIGDSAVFQKLYLDLAARIREKRAQASQAETAGRSRAVSEPPRAEAVSSALL